MLDGRGAYQRVAEAVQQIASTHGISRYFGPNEPLVDGGMTSLAMVELILAIEHRFDVLIPDRELTPSSFACIESIARMISRVTGSELMEEAAV